MASTIHSNITNLYYKNASQALKGGAMGKGTAAGLAGKADKGDKADKPKDPFMEKYGGDFDVELSKDGLAALEQQRMKIVGKADKDGGTPSAEDRLSDKAKDYLAKLREKYGDYDFIIADDVNDPKAMDQATKQYSVILRGDELERMANDEEYAAGVMEKVESAIDMTKRIEEKGELGEGVHFKRISITFDDDGNMKLFAELEKMSEQQKERMEKAKEKREEEEAKADKEKEKEKGEEKKPMSLQRTRVEASSEEELLEKILGIDWNEIPAGPVHPAHHGHME